MAFFKFHFLNLVIQLSFRARKVGKVSFYSKFLTDYYIDCNSKAVKWDLFSDAYPYYVLYPSARIDKNICVAETFSLRKIMCENFFNFSTFRTSFSFNLPNFSRWVTLLILIYTYNRIKPSKRMLQKKFPLEKLPAKIFLTFRRFVARWI